MTALTTHQNSGISIIASLYEATWKLLKSMMQIIRHSSTLTGKIQEKINSLNEDWNHILCELDKTYIISSSAGKYIIPILDLSDFSDMEAFDMMAWAYLLLLQITCTKKEYSFPLPLVIGLISTIVFLFMMLQVNIQNMETIWENCL